MIVTKSVQSPPVDMPLGAASGDGSEDGGPYVIDLAVYAVYEPSAFPEETWVRYACIGTPGVSYAGDFDLIRVHARIRHPDGVWDSRENDEYSVCDLNEGIDTFGNISIPAT